MPLYDILFLGTGDRGIPDIDCVTRKDGSACDTCASAVAGNTKDQRRGTCVAITASDEDGSRRILLDLPMDFYVSACKFAERYRHLLKSEAILVGNSHEAMNGIGEVSNWTMGGWERGAVRNHMDVYLSEFSLTAFEKRIPYMVDRRKSSTGYPPTLAFHGIKEYEPFKIRETKITPLPLFTKGSNEVSSLGYLIDKEIAYINCDGLLLEEAQQTLLEAKPPVVILRCNKEGTGLPALASLFGKNTRVFLVNIGHEHSHEKLSNLQTEGIQASVMPAFDGQKISN